MNHGLALPILVPLAAGAVLVLVSGRGIALERAISLTATLALALVNLYLLAVAAGGSIETYYVGDWPAPYGIVLVLDRLSALLLVLTSLLAVASLVHALYGEDSRGPYFHALFQFQLFGVNGAFLTGDLFNLFVFFEILLMASYCLLLHGGGRDRVRAGVHFVVLNVIGSSLFLVALGCVYAATGTLNMADLAAGAGRVAPGAAPLLQFGALLLLVVFGFKAAVLPLGFWLPSAYRAAGASVACLFAIMTKVGVYSILRVHVLLLDAAGSPVAGVAASWLLPLALATVVAGTLGALASHGLRRLACHLVLVSIGTLLTAVALAGDEALAAAVFYLVHSTLVSGGLFLLVDLVARQRGEAGDALARAQAVAQPATLGALFFLGAVAIAGLPPLSGFAGKVYILEAASNVGAAPWVWTVLLASSLLVIVSLARAASAVFWRTGDTAPTPPAASVPVWPAAALLGCAGLVMVIAGPVADYAAATADQLSALGPYAESVLRNDGVGEPASWRGDR